ncbi:MAG: UpxY family transcription antiterminator [Terriglobales bacterium]
MAATSITPALRGAPFNRLPGDAAGEGMRWYAAYANVRHEKQIALQLEGRSLDCFLPLYKSVRRWKDRRKEITLPLFPGYLFVRMALRDRLKVISVPGVVHIVSFQGELAALPDTEIETLRQRLRLCGGVEPHPYLTLGARVRVRSGPLAGLEGILVRRKDKFRIVLSIELIMRSIAVEVDEADIDPVGRTASRI